MQTARKQPITPCFAGDWFGFACDGDIEEARQAERQTAGGVEVDVL